MQNVLQWSLWETARTPAKPQTAVAGLSLCVKDTTKGKWSLLGCLELAELMVGFSAPASEAEMSLLH